MTRIEKLRANPARPPRAPRRPSGPGDDAGPRHLRRLFVLERLEDRTLLASSAILNALMMPVPKSSPTPLAIPLDGGSTTPVGLKPTQVLQAYGFNTIGFNGGVDGDGTGQTVAIVDAYTDPNIKSDLAQFDAAFSLPTASLTIETTTEDGAVTNAPPPSDTDAPWGLETALDVEWTHALAPGASILLVETPDSDQGLLDGVIDASKNAAVSVISMSWNEASITNDAIFKTPIGHQGITFVAATGDDGAQAGYPASSEDVLAVGGTEFATPLDSSGDYPAGGEEAWDGSSGGVDPTETQLPAQQVAVGNLGGRATPDVSFDAHSNVAVYDSYDYGGTPWVAVFGTSIGAPAWSSLVAIADQGLVLNGQPTMDGATQTIPALYSIVKTGNESAGFNDVSTGGNSIDQAGPGYDLVTGLGTPKAAYIAAALSGDVDALALISPGPQAVVGATTPTFRWSAVAGAAGYFLTVTDTVTGHVVISQSDLTTNSYTPSSSTTLPSGDAFSWDVSVVTATGTAAPNTPTASSFAVVPTPVPSIPSGTVDSTMPPFQWSTVAGAAGYDLTVTDTTTGLTVLNAQGLTSNSYTPTAPLTNLNTYEWAVLAYSAATNNNGVNYTSPSSGSAYFTVSVDIAPSPISPPNQSVVTTLTPTLQWSSVTGAVSYDVTLLDYSGYAVASGTEITSTSWTTPSLNLTNSSDDQYSWYVQANISSGSGTTLGPSSSRSVFTLGQVAEPTIISPQPNSTVTTAYPTLEWLPATGSQPGFDLSLLDITDNVSLIIAYQIYTDSFAIDFPLTNGHSYEWMISSFSDSVSLGTSGEFTVSVPGVGSESLAAPIPLGPEGVIATTSPVFTWTAVPGATGYILYYSRDGQTPVSTPENVSGTSAEPILDGSNSIGNTYIWSVSAYDASGDVSPPSQSFDFTPSITQAGQLPAPTGLTPSGNVTSSTSPTFQWQAVTGAFEYGIEVDDETTGTEVVETSVTGTSYTPDQQEEIFGSPLTSGHQYRWYLEAFSSGSDSSRYGVVTSQTFTYSPPSTATPQVISPGAGTTVNTSTPPFQWSAVTGAVDYLLYISDPDEFDTEDEFFLYDITVNGTSYTPSDALLDGHAYQWQVCAVFDENGVNVPGPTSAPTEFFVSVPGTVALVANGDSGTLSTATPTFNWSSVSGAAGYDLYLIDTTTGTQVFDALPLVTNSFPVTAPLNNGDSYQWYVSAFDNVGDTGLASTPLNFTISVSGGGLPTATLKSPTGKTKVASPVFQWTSVPSAVGYSLTIQDTTSGKSIVSGLPVHGLMYTPSPPLAANDSYTWYVRAIYSNGTIGPKPDAAAFDVSTASDLSGPPIPESPAGSVRSTTPTFQWSAVANAVAYEFEVFATVDNLTFYPITPTTVVGTSFTPSFPLGRGLTYTWQVAALDSSGQQTAYSSPLTFKIPSGSSGDDFDGDGESDLVVFQPSTSSFFVTPSSGTPAPYIVQFGQGSASGGDPIPVVGDYDGDGTTDFVVFQPSTSTFFVIPSSNQGQPYAIQFGQGSDTGGDPIPVVGDFDGDGKADFAVFQPSTSTFFVIPSSNPGQPYAVQFGQGATTGGDPIPVVGDYDGDGKADFAVFQPSSSTFFVMPSSGTPAPYAVQFGQGSASGGDPIPVVGDYDGDGKTDFAVFQPSTSTFFVIPSSNQGQPYAVQFGQGSAYGGDPIPVVGDFDGDGKSDLAVFQPSTSTFFVIPSSNQVQPYAAQFGQGSDTGGNPVPLPASSEYDFGGRVSILSLKGEAPATLGQVASAKKVATLRGIPRLIPTVVPQASGQETSDTLPIRRTAPWLGRGLVGGRGRG